MTTKSKRSDQEWMLLIHQLPPKPTNLRVGTWRKLQKLGAVYADHLTDSAHAARTWRRVLDLQPGHQRALRVAIVRARQLALLPYAAD